MAKNVLKSWCPLSFCLKIFWFSEFVWPTLYTWRPKAKFFRSFWEIPEADLVAMICPDFWVWTKQKVFNKRGWLNVLCFFRICFYVRTTRGWDNFQKKAERKPLFFCHKSGNQEWYLTAFIFIESKNKQPPTPFPPPLKKREHDSMTCLIESIN